MSCNCKPQCKNVVKKKPIETIEDLIASFTPDIEMHDQDLSSLKSFTDFVCGAVNDTTKAGYKKFTVDRNHQRFYNRPIAKQHVEMFIEELENDKNLLEKDYNNFEELFEDILGHRKLFVGATGVYDAALRLGWNREVISKKKGKMIIPQERVYLHTGPLRSAILIFDILEGFPKFRKNNLGGSYYVPYSELPEVFAKCGLKAKDVEHFLCCRYDNISYLYTKKTGKEVDKNKIKLEKRHLYNNK